MAKIKDGINLSFDDVLLEPKCFSGNSRSEANLSTNIGGLNFEIPIISANMPSVTEVDMCVAMAKLGGLGIIHRMQSIESQACMIEECTRNLIYGGYIGAAIGIGDDWRDRATELIIAGADIICLDVANGHMKRVKEVAQKFKNNWSHIPLIVGNIATNEAAIYLGEVSPILKVGCGSGALCSTRIKTGCGKPLFQSIVETDKKYEIIADGGIRNSGDIVKSLAAGAKMVMVGNLLAGTDESPGEVIKGIDGNKYKIYRGAASYGAKKSYFGRAEYIEGEETLVPYKGSVKKNVQRLCEGIKSGFSYCGAQNLKELQENAIFIRITSAGFKESVPHGLL